MPHSNTCIYICKYISGAAKTMKNEGYELQPSFSRVCDGKPGF